MIRVLVPDMPTAEELLPFLLEMDANRVYVNQGPMLRRLEAGIETLVGAPCKAVSNGTLALELALRAMSLPRGAGVLVPAATFSGSALAIVNAGLQPVFCDVDPVTWQLTPEIAGAVLPLCREENVRAVMPVATYGAPVPIEPWERFNYETNLPVLIDAAGAILAQKTSEIPEIVVTYSLHATKAIGAGEGGIVATHDRILLERVESLATFGPGGTNAKMSEYHAAVGLASLARGGHDQRGLIFDAYQRQMPPGIAIRSVPAQTLLPALLPDVGDPPRYRGIASRTQEALAARGIESKLWYRSFPVERGEFFNFPKIGPLTVTEMLRQRCLGLPFHPWLSADDVAHVCKTLTEVLPA